MKYFKSIKIIVTYFINEIIVVKYFKIFPLFDINRLKHMQNFK